MAKALIHTPMELYTSGNLRMASCTVKALSYTSMEQQNFVKFSTKKKERKNGLITFYYLV